MSKSTSGLRARVALAVMLCDAPLLAIIFTALPPVLPMLAEHFSQGDDGRLVAQMIMTAPSAGLIIGGALNGWMVDRCSPRSMYLLGLAMFALFGSAGMYLDSAAVLLGSRFLLGIAAMTVTTAAVCMLMASCDITRQARLLGLRNSVGSLIGAVTIFLAAPAAEWGGWRVPFAFYLSSLAVLAIAVVALPGVPNMKREQRAQTSRDSIVHLWPVYLATVLLYIVVFATLTQLSFLLADEGIRSPSAQSWIFGAGPAASVVGAALYGSIRNRLGSRPTLVLVLMAIGVGNAVLGMGHTGPVFASGNFVASFGYGMITPYLCQLVFDNCAVASRGRAAGLLYSSMFFGDFISPLVFRPVSTILGLHGAILMLGVLVLIAATVLMLISPTVASRILANQAYARRSPM
jgi:MFS family permease